MSTGNLAVVNFSGGEVSPLIYGRVDLPINLKGLEWQKNFYSLLQGGSRFRNGWKNVHNTKAHGLGSLIKFVFSQSDTYMLLLQDKGMRVYRNDAPVTLTPKNITAITQANPGQLTITGHGFSTGDEIFITGVKGMTDVSEQFFLAQVVDPNNITLKDTFGNAINTTNFQAYTSGGTAAKIFEFAMPYASADVSKVHYTQGADTMHFASAGYPPFYLHRRDHTKWYVTTAQLSNPRIITNITQANPGVFTTQNDHGLAVDDHVWLDDIEGMTEINKAHFLVNTTPSTTTFTLKATDAGGTALNTNPLTAYTAGGVLFSRTARTADPFGQKTIRAISQANPGVFNVSAHGLKVGEEIYVADVNGMTQVNNNRYFINTVASVNTFTVKDANGTPVDTTGFSAYRTGGQIIKIANCPQTVAFLQEARKAYGGWTAQPDGIAMSKAPDSATGATRFEDFTTGANDTDGIRFTLASVFNTLEAVLWMGVVNDELIIGTTGSIRRLQGGAGNAFITPSSIKAPAVNNVGTLAKQPISNGRSLYYIEDTSKSVKSFVFDFDSNGFTSIDNNLTNGNLTNRGIVQLAEQQGKPDILWALRKDGILAGLTFKESENIYAWHRHEVAGQSRDEDNRLQPRGKVISIAVIPRANNVSRLWAIIEREFNGVTSRYVEYLSDVVAYEVVHHYVTGTDYETQVADVACWQNARREAVRDDVYVDSSVSYDGRLVGAGKTLTPAATTGNSINFDTNSSFFDSSMIGRQLIKTYSREGEGGGVAEIVSITSGTRAVCNILVDFDSTNAIASGQWIITTNTIRGLRIFEGQTVRVQTDGADGGEYEIENGVLSLNGQSGVIHVGLPYKGLWITTNMDVAGVIGSAQAKVRRILNYAMRVFASMGFKIGTTPWNARDAVLRLNEDLTDVPNVLYDGIVDDILADGHSRQSKQICVVKDTPTPLTILSIDAKIEVEDA